ncbi:hypothetical protein [Echinicola salinicaeni]|uniref:hypothetical protein n=1 Tax=Echinicola salinicaeni TaxID=2762757 RepID=UPI00164698E1|nr:hypothetical protein [Echinicola salinicaeni]
MKSNLSLKISKSAAWADAVSGDSFFKILSEPNIRYIKNKIHREIIKTNNSIIKKIMDHNEESHNPILAVYKFKPF